MRKRDLLRRSLDILGASALMWKLLPPGLYCFNYHRLGDPNSTDFNRNIFSCSAERFEEHVAYLKDRFEIIRLSRLLDVIRTGYRDKRPLALITFDDGYIDNYSIALPILRRYEASATFFLPTAFIGSDTLPWWEELHWHLRQVAGRSIRLTGAAEPFAIRTDDGEASIRRVATFVKSRPIPMDEQMHEVRQVCGNLFPPHGNHL